jgi:predicted choloylglycine hydrolase
MTPSLVFDAVAEGRPGLKWSARWARSWPAYRAWFSARGGERGPSRAVCEAALAAHMPELVQVHRRLTQLAGGGDVAARFLSTWCPPRYLGGCSVAALARDGVVRLVRNYDLSPDLNEGLLLRSEWTGSPVMGMVEFLWGVSDGVNVAGLALALAYGGRPEVARGFGVTTILRYVLETCGTVAEALAAMRRIPSHMAYNVVLADHFGATASVELYPGGGLTLRRPAVATNHQRDTGAAAAGAAGSHARRLHLEWLLAGGIAPGALDQAFLEAPLYQSNHAGGFGTLFTAVYDPAASALTLRWPEGDWQQSLDDFTEGRRAIAYDPGLGHGRTPEPAAALAIVAALGAARPFLSPAGARMLGAWCDRARNGCPDWASLGAAFTR